MVMTPVTISQSQISSVIAPPCSLQRMKQLETTDFNTAPAQISKILGPVSATFPDSENEKNGNDTEMNENIRPFTWHNQLKIDIFQINTACRQTLS